MMGEMKGKAVELGLIPCRICGERHVKMGYGKDKAPSWEMNGHAYFEIEPRKYIQMQRDEYNQALKTIRMLKSKIFRLEKRKK
jgi:hypothetical protein